ncbi:MAG: hypothetical protein IJA58_01085 [Lachnospiraceae bacterium]|nr:hypothetical protein [Lachnospiraceae bacterium]
MKFGSQEIFNQICAMITDPDSSSDYEMLYETVRTDTLALIRRDTFSEDEREDIVQNVELAVFRGLVRFAERFAEKSPEERNKFLCGIVYRKRADCLAQQYRAKNFVSYDVDDAPEIASDELLEERFMDRMQLRQDMLNSIYEVCSLRTTPDKIIAFFFNKLSAALGASGKNGSPAEVRRMLAECTQRQAANAAVRELEHLMGCRIPKKIVAPLYSKLAEVTAEGVRGDLPFTLTVRDITDSSSWISSKMRKQKESILGGKGHGSASEI